MSKHDDWDIDSRTGDFYCESGIYGYGPRSGGGGIVKIPLLLICTFSGIFIQTLLYMMLGIEIEDVPGIVMLLLWFVFSTLFTLCVGYLIARLKH